jgi:ATP-dependent DNA helicase DinG
VSLRQAVAEILRPGGALEDALPGYESRPGQLAMAIRVAEALDSDERLLLEAGTGTGKTMAYLVPAILSGRKVVVSTGTRTLQDQIARVDLPRLQRVLRTPFRYTVMKGMSNYVCRRRFDEYTRQLVLHAARSPEMEHIQAWVDRTASGDKADLADVPDESPLWREITAAPETRLGGRCPYNDLCFVTRVRRAALASQVVVVNHHLFLADLALRTRWPDAQVLPPYEAVIFDEAHQVEDVATEVLGVQVSTARLFALARDVGRAPVPPLAESRAHALAHSLESAVHVLGDALRARLPSSAGEEVRVEMPDDLWNTLSLRRYHELDGVLEEIAAFTARLTEDDMSHIERPTAPSPAVAAVLGGLARRAAALRDDLGEIVGTARRDCIRWIVLGRRNITLRASPVSAAPLLRDSFDRHSGPILFTSATLSAGGSFDYVRDRLGLTDTASEATFPSPFRFGQQALLYLPADLPDPNQETFSVAAAVRALELCRLSRGRALLLFTSFRNLRICEDVMRADGGFPLLVQGERPRHALLADLRRNLGSVLLATQSFWEGVDVPGEALSLVVIDRLPFAVPNDPLTAARIERIREDGGDPFAAFQLPRAALALKQGFGRLVRTRSDRGVVAILDGRLMRRRYGSALLASLPPECPRTEEIDDVAQFFAV